MSVSLHTSGCPSGRRYWAGIDVEADVLGGSSWLEFAEYAVNGKDVGSPLGND